MTKRTLLAAVAALTMTAPLMPADAADPAAIARGKYLVGIASCHDCHTPGYFLGKPDMARYLGGSDVGFELPGLGVFHGPNLTPDKETGLGNWTDAQVLTALQTGVRPDGRVLAPIMPWRAFAPWRMSNRTISGDRFMTAKWMGRCSSPYDIVKSASSGRAWSIQGLARRAQSENGKLPKCTGLRAPWRGSGTAADRSYPGRRR